MRAIILLNGEPYRGEIKKGEGDVVLCCDGAYNWAKGKIEIDENLGDFDSVKEAPVPPPKKIYPSEKDMTDGEIAIDRAKELRAESIEIYGGGGRREDHFLGNLHLLYRAVRKGMRAVLVTNTSKITLLGKGEHSFSANKNSLFSLLPFGGDVHIMNMQGLKYAEDDLILRRGTTRGISNLVTENTFSISVSEGFALAILSEEEK